ncbi:MAG: lysophospholipid acyltransferase family protein [Gemmatimonadota bacterium]
MIFQSAWAILNGIIATLVLSSAVVIASLFNHHGNLYDRIAHAWGRWIIWASGVRVVVEGEENVRPDCAQIIASNHQSWYDVFALAAILPKRFRFIAKAELRRIPLFGRAWESAGHISIRRQDRAKAIAALDAAARLVRSDNSAIMIFPEGTRSPTGCLLPFKKGAFMLGLQTGLEIGPAAVIGSRAVQKKNDWRVHAGTIIVRFGEPIDSSQFDEAHREQLSELVRARIEQMLQHPQRPWDLIDHVGDHRHSRA